MKNSKMLAIVVLALALMVWPVPMARCAISLTLNGQDVDFITLEQGQSCTVEVVSDDSSSYEAYVGFDDDQILGSFSHLETRPEAGERARVEVYDEPPFYGYYIKAYGLLPAPSPGVHFVFEYVAQQPGGAVLVLYDETFTTLIDHVFIVVEQLPPAAMGTAFTYQGSLMDSNSPANGLYDFQFRLYNQPDPSFAVQQGSTIDINDLDVIDGHFTVLLDFGSDPNIFNGEARWLQITVAQSDGSDRCTLSPMWELTPVPYAIFARNGGGDNDWMVSGDDMYSIPSGNVGIGTDSPRPSYKLTVEGENNNGVRASGLIVGGYFETESADGYALIARNDYGIAGDFMGDVLVHGYIDSYENYKLTGQTVLSNTGSENIFVGQGTGASITTGSRNSAVGFQALNSNINGWANSALGRSSLSSNTKGGGNSAVGERALRFNTEGSNNTAIGTSALYNNLTGIYNTAVGVGAGSSNSTGSYNVFLGYQAGFNETGSNKLYIANGYINPPLIYGEFDTGEVGIGTKDPNDKLDVFGHINASESYKLDGSSVLNNNGPNNIFVGQGAGTSITTGHSNSAIGVDALNRNRTGYANSAVGFNALSANDGGNYNTAIGFSALKNSRSDYENTAVGCESLFNNGGYANSAVGFRALYSNGGGDWNTAVGNSALYSNINGTHNTAIGCSALGLATGAGNTAVGNGAGTHTFGNGNVFLGHWAGHDEVGSNRLYIHNGSSNPPLIYGMFDLLRVGIGTSSPGYNLHVAGITASTGGFVTASDHRLKENIAPVENALEKVSCINGIYFNKKDESPDKRQVGVIAQDVETVLPELVSTAEDGYKWVDYSQLTAVLVEAVKELKAENQELKEENREFRQRFEALEMSIRPILLSQAKEEQL